MIRMSSSVWTGAGAGAAEANSTDNGGRTVYGLQVRRTHIGDLDVSLGMSESGPSDCGLRPFRAVGRQLALVVSDGDLAVMVEDLKHICRQEQNTTPCRRLQEWVGCRVAGQAEASYILLVLWDRRHRWLWWFAGGLQTDPADPAGWWRTLWRPLRDLWPWNTEASARTGRHRLRPGGEWIFDARPADQDRQAFWLKIQLSGQVAVRDGGV